MKRINFKSERYKLVVLDANFYWTEQLFSAYSDFADILLLRPLDFRAFRKQYGSYFIDFQPQPLSPGVWEQRICFPPGWLFHYWPLTQRLLVSLIKRFQGSSSLVFVFNYPYYYSLLEKLKAYSIYYNIDDYRHYWPSRESQTPAVEKLAVARADLTLCVAHYRYEYLRKECPTKAHQIIHLPHGCSPEFMVDNPLCLSEPLLANFQGYSRPLAGYIGALTYRFDFNYLARVAEKLPDVTIILGGNIPQQTDGSAEWWQGVEAVRKLPNVHFIGRVPHKQLGQYLQSFDVLLMPYSLCNFNINACPTKLWDYMGTSLPIVANNVVPEVNLWRNVILVSENSDEFVKNIRFALTNRSWRSQERWEIAQDNTWARQAQKLYCMLEEQECLFLKSS